MYCNSKPYIHIRSLKTLLKFTQTQRSAHKGTHILFSTNLAQLEMAPYRNTFPVSKTAIIYNHEMIMKS